MNISIHKFFCYLLLILLLLYNLMYVVAPEGGSLLMQGSIILVLLISIIYFFKTLVHKHKAENRLFFRAWTAFLLLNIVGFIFTAEYTNRKDYGMFLGILVTFLTFYPFYYFSRLGLLTSKKLIWFFIALIPIVIYGFYSTQAEIISSRTNGNSNVVNNMAYFFVRLMPFVFLIRKHKMFSIISMMVLMIFVIKGSKRGALIIGAITLLMYFYSLLKTHDKRKRIQGYMMVFPAIVILGFSAYRFVTENQFLINRLSDMTEGDASERDVLYSVIFHSWFSIQNFDNFLFGYGFGGSRMITGGLFAHNDWLEIVSNFGLLGGGLYLILMFAGFKFSLNKKLKLDKKILMRTIMVAWFCTSLISMWYMNIQGYTNTILLAYLIGNKSNSLE